MTGGHAINDCAACHDTNNFAAASPDCISCHQPDYNGAKNPDHQALGFSQECATCHTTESWDGAQFPDHDFFPLTGGHAINDCAACHDTNNFAAASPDCISCHQSDYNSTRSPNHQTSGFNTECILCHDTNAWKPADFLEHDALYFPIYSGRHREQWDSCVECHTNSGSYATFSFTDCHEHSSQSNVTRDHEGVRNFVYQSAACFQCHPDGRN